MVGNEPFCEWHVIHIEDDEGGEREYTVLHPEGCALSVSTQGTVEYQCWVGWELANSGWIAYFDPKVVSPGWYRIRGRTFSQYYPMHGTEWDSESESEKIEWVPMDTEHEIQRGMLET